MGKLRVEMDDGKVVGYSFVCPGCSWRHVFWTDSPHYPKWLFNGCLEKPSFTPSLLNWNDSMRCHVVVTDGVINFCGDCSHVLRGLAVVLADE